MGKPSDNLKPVVNNPSRCDWIELGLRYLKKEDECLEWHGKSLEEASRFLFFGPAFWETRKCTAALKPFRDAYARCLGERLKSSKPSL